MKGLQLRSCTPFNKVGWALPNNDKISLSEGIRQCPPYKKQLIENGARSQLKPLNYSI